MATAERAALRQHLADSLAACLEYGHWGFRHPSGYPAGHSDQRIVPNQMYEQRQAWAELLSDLVLEQPTGGLIGLCELGDEVDWCAPVNSLLEQRGVPLPVSGVTGYGISQFGPRLTSYPPGSGVTVFTAVTTTGRELLTFRGMLAARGLSVQRMLSLVHCGPTLPRGILGMPYAAAVHFPLPITPATACFECLLGRPVRPLAS